MVNYSKSFGGYQSLDRIGPFGPLIKEEFLLSTGRACLAIALRTMRPKRMHVPFFICGSALDPLVEEGVEPCFYELDDHLLPLSIPKVGADEMILFVDYFGLCGKVIESRARELGPRAVVDHSLAFFAAPVAGCWNFTSARKFFGVPDGAVLHAPMEVTPPTIRKEDTICTHLLLASVGCQSEGLAYHRANEGLMSSKALHCSLVGQRLLEHIDRHFVRTARTSNFKAVHEQFHQVNQFKFDIQMVDGPYHYPLVLDSPINLTEFHSAGIYAPLLWPDVLERSETPEALRSLIRRMLLLPVDQRYDEVDMRVLAKRVVAILGSE